MQMMSQTSHTKGHTLIVLSDFNVIVLVQTGNATDLPVLPTKHNRSSFELFISVILRQINSDSVRLKIPNLNVKNNYGSHKYTIEKKDSCKALFEV